MGWECKVNTWQVMIAGAVGYLDLVMMMIY